MPGPSGVVQAGGMMKGDSRIQQAGLFHHSSSESCDSCAHVPGAHGSMFGPHFSKHGSGHFSHVGHGAGHGGGMGGGAGGYSGGIFPVPGQGAPGAVAAVGAIVPGMGGPGGAMSNGRTSVKFVSPPGMKVTWQLPTGEFNPEASGLTAQQSISISRIT
jgi:hypothetical protein